MKLNNENIGIIGLGKYGLYLAKELSKTGKSLLCIDKDENKVKKVVDFAEASFVTEDLTTKTLEDTGFKECNTIIICISEHLDTAIFATLNCINLGVNKVITLSNSEEQGIVLEKLGAEVIYPYKDSVNYLVKKIANTNFLDFLALSDDVEILEVRVPKFLIGKSLIESDLRKKYELNLIAIEKNKKIITNINPNYIFEKEDAIVLIGEKKALINFQNIK